MCVCVCESCTYQFLVCEHSRDFVASNNIEQGLMMMMMMIMMKKKMIKMMRKMMMKMVVKMIKVVITMQLTVGVKLMIVSY